MPFDGSGTYAPPSAPTFPAVSGAVISSSYYNAVINDLATALNNTLTRDGQGRPSVNIDWNAKNLTNVAAFAATGNATIGGTFGVTGATTLAALTASGLATLNAGATITGAVGITGVLTQTGTVNITGDVNITDASPTVTLKDSDSLKAVATIRFDMLDSANASVGWFGFNGDSHFNIQNSAGGEVRVGGSRILTTADEGSGNALDADTVDGQHATIFNYRANNLSDVADAAAARSNLGLVIDTNVQAYNANLTTWAGKTVPSGTVVGTTDAQTLTNKTLTSPTINGGSLSSAVTAVTQSAGDNTTAIATTAFVRAQIPSELNASGSAPLYAVRAWGLFNGSGVVSILGSGNISSVTDGGTGLFTPNFTTAMPSANFSCVANYNLANTSALSSNDGQASPYGYATGSVTLRTMDGAAVAMNPARVSFTIVC